MPDLSPRRLVVLKGAPSTNSACTSARQARRRSRSSSESRRERQAVAAGDGDLEVGVTVLALPTRAGPAWLLAFTPPAPPLRL